MSNKNSNPVYKGEEEPLPKRLQEFDKRSRGVIKKFYPFGKFNCPPRLVANVYSGCGYHCKYCYIQWMAGRFKPRPKSNFLKKLEKDLELITEYRLENLPVSVSNSTDPLQPCEDKYGHTGHLLQKLNRKRLKVLLITKNPSKLLEKAYLKELSPSRTYIQVSIPFLYRREIEPVAPPPAHRLKAVKELKSQGLSIGIRVDPLIPRVSRIEGQSRKEIKELINKLAQIGVTRVTSKSLRLVGAIKSNFPKFYKRLKPFYKQHGSWQNNCYSLNQRAKRKLLLPVYKACNDYGIGLSTCYENHDLPGISSCDQAKFEPH